MADTENSAAGHLHSPLIFKEHFFFKVIQHQKILLKIASVITSSDELITLGVYLGCDPNDVRRLKNGNMNLKEAAYEILWCFYNSAPDAERWIRITEALEELKKHGTLKELRLEKLHSQICP